MLFHPLDNFHIECHATGNAAWRYHWVKLDSHLLFSKYGKELLAGFSVKSNMGHLLTQQEWLAYQSVFITMQHEVISAQFQIWRTNQIG